MLQKEPFYIEEDERERAFVEMELRRHRHRHDRAQTDNASFSSSSSSSSADSTGTLDIEVTNNRGHEPFYDTRETKAAAAAANIKGCRRLPGEKKERDLMKPAKKMPTAATVGFTDLMEATKRLNEEEERVAAQRDRQRALEEEEAQAIRNRKWEEVKARLSQRNLTTPMVSLRSKEWDEDEEETDDEGLQEEGEYYARGEIQYTNGGDTVPLLPPKGRHGRNPYDKTIYDDPQDYAYRNQLTQKEGDDNSTTADGATARSTVLTMDDPFANDDEKPMRKLMKREVIAPVARAWHNVYNWGIYFVLALGYMPGVSIYEASKPDYYYQDTYHE